VVAKDFKVDLLYSVPKETYGSWVCMTPLPDGRLVVSDQYGSLYYVTLPTDKDPIGIEKIPADVGMAQGLLWAFDSLYVVVNASGKSGLYRVTASQNGGKLDKVELLRKFEGGGGEHGPHAVLLHPDGKRLTVVCGNQTKILETDTSLVPRIWGDDHLLPRMPDGRGFMAGVKAPGGAIYHVTPDGKTWELLSVGFRNQYDAAYAPNGDLFTYDADMEWDFNTPWYRPTRVCQVTAGSEFGWRNGAGKYPAYYVDSLPGICDIGPGSPTGVVFGTGAKFPAKYQKALFICDWSYGKLYAIHLAPNGSTMKGTAEEFIAGTPLQLTDLTIHPKDGAMYFLIGGRRTQSGLYRVTYTGKESTAPAVPEGSNPTRDQRLALEAQFGKKLDEAGLTKLFQELKSTDRFVRFAARTSLEHQDPKLWSETAFGQNDPQTIIHSMLALIRTSAKCPDHDEEKKGFGTPELRAKILAKLATLNFNQLTDEQKLDLVRVYHVLFHRFGAPNEAEQAAWLKTFDPIFPTGQRYLDSELCQIFAFLQVPQATGKTVKLLLDAPTQEEQIEYARALRVVKAGWTPELRKDYLGWLARAYAYKGGNSFAGFLDRIKADAVATLTAEEKTAYKALLEVKPAEAPKLPPRPFVKKYTLTEVVPLVDKGLKAGGRDFDKGRKMFAAANCFACHRFDNEGGSQGPDLTGAGAKFNLYDLVETIIDPNKEISDQYANAEIDTLDGRKVVGRIINFSGDNMTLLPNMLAPNETIAVKRGDVDRIVLSKISPMPAGLLDTLNEDEIIDLMAYLLARGDRTAPYFKK
jgi:putative heme-binding domain-containing protein